MPAASRRARAAEGRDAALNADPRAREGGEVAGGTDEGGGFDLIGSVLVRHRVGFSLESGMALSNWQAMVSGEQERPGELVRWEQDLLQHGRKDR